MKNPVRPSAALQMSIFPHENDQRAPRAREGLTNSALGPPVGLSIERPPARTPTKKFTANTCPKCGTTTIAGLVLGIRVDLEPTTLTDHDEYQAIRDHVRTYNLHHDRTIIDRGVAEIRGPTTVDRHARHVCGTTYGTQPRTRTVTRTPIDHTEPPF